MLCLPIAPTNLSWCLLHSSPFCVFYSPPHFAISLLPFPFFATVLGLATQLIRVLAFSFLLLSYYVGLLGLPLANNNDNITVKNIKNYL